MVAIVQFTLSHFCNYSLGRFPVESAAGLKNLMRPFLNTVCVPPILKALIHKQFPEDIQTQLLGDANQSRLVRTICRHIGAEEVAWLMCDKAVTARFF